MTLRQAQDVAVALVIVSHSVQLADGVVELAAQMARNVELRAAGGTPAAALRAAADAAAKGSDDTIPLRASKGRASYLGERSMGHRDPGSLSTTIILKAAADAAEAA